MVIYLGSMKTKGAFGRCRFVFEWKTPEQYFDEGVTKWFRALRKRNKALSRKPLDSGNTQSQYSLLG